MSADLNTLNKPQKMNLAQKHLQKYISEIKRHFDFSDFQILTLLEKTSSEIKKDRKNKILSFLQNIFLFVFIPSSATDNDLLNKKTNKN